MDNDIVTYPSPVRILYLLNAASPGSGAVIGLLQLLRGLPPDCYEAYLILPQEPSDEQRAVFANAARGYRVVPQVWWTRNQHAALLPQALNLAYKAKLTRGYVTPTRAVRRAIRDWGIDLVYTNTALILEGALAARLEHVPHIWHVKEWIGNNAVTRFPLPDPLLARTFTGLSARVVVMTRFLGDFFVRHDCADRIDVVYDGIILDDFAHPSDPAPLRERLGVTHDETLFGMVASLGAPWKRHDLFIDIAAEASRHWPEARFAIFGALPQSGNAFSRSHYERLVAQVHAAGLAERFIWAGLVTDIPQMMRAIDVLIHPTAHEPFGRIVIEALAAGTPAIGARGGGLLESIGHKQTGLLVEPDNIAAFVDAVGTLLHDPDLRRQYGTEGSQQIAARFNVERHVTAMTAIFERALAQRDR